MHTHPRFNPAFAALVICSQCMGCDEPEQSLPSEPVVARAVESFAAGGSVASVDFSPNAQLLAAGIGTKVAGKSSDGSASVWAIGSTKARHELSNTDCVRVVRFSPDGDWLVTTGLDGVTVRSVGDWSTVGILTSWKPATAIAFRGESKDMVVGRAYRGLGGGSWDEPFLRIWPEKQVVIAGNTFQKGTDWEDRRPMSFLENRHIHVSCLAYTTDGSALIIGGRGTGLRLSNSTPDRVQEDGLIGRCATATESEYFVRLPGMTVTDCSLSRDDRHIAYSLIASGHSLAESATDDETLVHILNAATGERLPPLSGCTGRVNAVAFCPAHDVIAAADEDGNILFWSLKSPAEVLCRIKDDAEVHCLAFSRDGRWLASGNAAGTVRTWTIVFKLME